MSSTPPPRSHPPPPWASPLPPSSSTFPSQDSGITQSPIPTRPSPALAHTPPALPVCSPAQKERTPSECESDGCDIGSHRVDGLVDYNLSDPVDRDAGKEELSSPSGPPSTSPKASLTLPLPKLDLSSPSSPQASPSPQFKSLQPLSLSQVKPSSPPPSPLQASPASIHSQAPSLMSTPKLSPSLPSPPCVPLSLASLKLPARVHKLGGQQQMPLDTGSIGKSRLREAHLYDPAREDGQARGDVLAPLPTAVSHFLKSRRPELQ